VTLESGSEIGDVVVIDLMDGDGGVEGDIAVDTG
jgi:hypothetical protein